MQGFGVVAAVQGHKLTEVDVVCSAGYGSAIAGALQEASSCRV
jgi:hypothetical protein